MKITNRKLINTLSGSVVKCNIIHTIQLQYLRLSKSFIEFMQTAIAVTEAKRCRCTMQSTIVVNF